MREPAPWRELAAAEERNSVGLHASSYRFMMLRALLLLLAALAACDNNVTQKVDIFDTWYQVQWGNVEGYNPKSE